MNWSFHLLAGLVFLYLISLWKHICKQFLRRCLPSFCLLLLLLLLLLILFVLSGT
jgi:hypothetical protein